MILCAYRLQFCKLHHASPGNTAHYPALLLSLPVPLPPVLISSPKLKYGKSFFLALPDFC
jgi:hypothetical protein